MFIAFFEQMVFWRKTSLYLTISQKDNFISMLQEWVMNINREEYLSNILIKIFRKIKRLAILLLTNCRTMF